MMVAVLIYAKIRNYPLYTRASFREFLSALGGASFALLTPAIIVGGVVFGLFTPTEASVVAVIYTLIVGLFIYRSLGFSEVPGVLYNSARFAAISLFCVGTASAFGWILAYFQIPRSLVKVIEGWGAGLIGTGFIVAGAFLIIGMFIDAIPAIIILGTILWPVTQNVGMHPIHFAIIGVISLAFGLVTPPYGLCLLIACSLGKIKLVDALKDVAIILIPMLLVLTFVILFPGVILFLPRLLMAKYIK